MNVILVRSNSVLGGLVASWNSIGPPYRRLTSARGEAAPTVIINGAKRAKREILQRPTAARHQECMPSMAREVLVLHCTALQGASISRYRAAPWNSARFPMTKLSRVPAVARKGSSW